MRPVFAGRPGRVPWLSLLPAGLLAAGLLALSACGPAASSSASAAAAAQSGCQQVSAVLSDGPDPGTDPVGYAEAQIRPLRQIHTGDTSLRAAADRLSSAYQRFFDSNGAGSARQAVRRASHDLDAICPGAAS